MVYMVIITHETEDVHTKSGIWLDSACFPGFLHFPKDFPVSGLFPEMQQEKLVTTATFWLLPAWKRDRIQENTSERKMNHANNNAVE